MPRPKSPARPLQDAVEPTGIGFVERGALLAVGELASREPDEIACGGWRRAMANLVSSTRTDDRLRRAYAWLAHLDWALLHGDEETWRSLDKAAEDVTRVHRRRGLFPDASLLKKENEVTEKRLEVVAAVAIWLCAPERRPPMSCWHRSTDGGKTFGGARVVWRTERSIAAHLIDKLARLDPRFADLPLDVVERWIEKVHPSTTGNPRAASRRAPTLAAMLSLQCAAFGDALDGRTRRAAIKAIASTYRTARAPSSGKDSRRARSRIRRVPSKKV